MKKKQTQKGVKGAHQLQVGGDLVVTGVTYSEVQEIVADKLALVKNELTLQALELATKRMKAFSDRLISSLEAQGLLNAFIDPDFQFSIVDAERVAASNDDSKIEELLVEILAHRASQTKPSARSRLATSHAIRALDKLSDDALNGLTAIWAIERVISTRLSLNEKFENLEHNYQILIDMGLPEGRLWLDDLDVLRLVQSMGAGFAISRSSHSNFTQERFKGYLAPGLPNDEARELIAAAQRENVSAATLIIPHPLKDNTSFMLTTSMKELEELLQNAGLNLEELPRLKEYAERMGFGTEFQDCNARLSERLQASAPVQRVAEWWDALPYARVTLVGEVVGFTNANRFMTFGNAATITDLIDLLSKDTPS